MATNGPSHPLGGNERSFANDAREKRVASTPGKTAVGGVDHTEKSKISRYDVWRRIARGKMKNSSAAPSRRENTGGGANARSYTSASHKKPRVLSSQMVYAGKVFGIRRDEVIEPSGVRTTREVITHPGSAVVLPVLPDGRILLIRQYRHAARQYLWELVAGRIDQGETPREAAKRELREETGYRAKRCNIFLEFFPTPGFLEEKMYLLLAEGLTPGKAEPEDDEKIMARPHTRKQVEQMIRQGKVQDAKTIAGVLYYLRFLAR
jgi:ADP-ribose pyrophosphatase